MPCTALLQGAISASFRGWGVGLSAPPNIHRPLARTWGKDHTTTPASLPHFSVLTFLHVVVAEDHGGRGGLQQLPEIPGEREREKRELGERGGCLLCTGEPPTLKRSIFGEGKGPPKRKQRKYSHPPHQFMGDKREFSPAPEGRIQPEPTDSNDKEGDSSSKLGITF